MENKDIQENNKKVMNKKVLIPVVILTVVTVTLITLFLTSFTKEKQVTPVENEAVVPTGIISPLAQSTLTMSPNPLYLDSAGNGKISVMLETKDNEVTAVQLELQFDPKAVTNVAIKPAGFFSNPVELMKRIDSQNGRITYMIGINPSQEPVEGNGPVAEITFKKVSTTNLTETQFTFSRTANSESIVAATGVDQSVLKQTTDTEILLSN